MKNHEKDNFDQLSNSEIASTGAKEAFKTGSLTHAFYKDMKENVKTYTPKSFQNSVERQYENTKSFMVGYAMNKAPFIARMTNRLPGPLRRNAGFVVGAGATLCDNMIHWDHLGHQFNSTATFFSKAGNKAADNFQIKEESADTVAKMM